MPDRVALIGSPLKRRHSKVMHEAAFAHFGIEATYDLLELSPDRLDGFFDDVRSPAWYGFQVTAPYKQEAARRCDRLTPEAETIGAVNTAMRESDGTLTGTNTDAPGFGRAVTEDLGRDLRGASVAVAGAGGAARAVVAAAVAAKARRVVVGARDPSQALTLARGFPDGSVTPVRLGEDFDGLLAGIDIGVNATTVGMTQAGMAFDPGEMSDGAAVFDLVYIPAETELLARARVLGLDAANGIGMLVAQAEIAFEGWTGHAGAGPVMRAALDTMD